MLAIAVTAFIYSDVGGIEFHGPSHHQEYGILDSLRTMILKTIILKTNWIYYYTAA